MKFFQLVPSDTNIDFISKFPIFIVGSTVVAIALLVGINTKGFNYGIDFTGGSLVQAKFAQATESDDVRKIVAELGAPDASVVSTDKTQQEYLITAPAPKDAKDTVPLGAKLTQKLGDKVTILKSDVVGPKVGKQLKTSAMLSLFLSILLIMIYIWLRFDLRFAPGATVAMIHDLVMVAGFYFISGTEFTITSIAVLLTVAGYSVNDTIVIYDRVRELFKKGTTSTETLPGTINRAINQTLSRTFLTSLVTLLSVIPIAILCEGELKAFAIGMGIGIFAGTYSTIYIASPMTIYVDKFLAARDKKKGVTAPRKVSA